MKWVYRRLLSAVLALAMVLPLVGCGARTPEETTEKLHIEADAPYSADALEYAEQTILSLVTYAYRQAAFDQISEKAAARLAGYARRACEISAQKPVTEEQYRAVMELLRQEGESVVDEVLSLRAGDASSYENTRGLYLELTYVFGAEQVASMLYDVCLLIYDARYERLMEKFADYQYPFYQEDADRVADQKAIFVNCVGKEDFSALIRCGAAMAELLSVESDRISAAFSDAEVLEVIRRLDWADIEIDEQGWELLLSYTPVPQDSAYRSALCRMIKEGEDLPKIASVANDALSLLKSATDHMEAADVAALRTGDREALLTAVFSRFDDAEWELFASVTSVVLSNEQYSALAREEYGEDYSAYLANLRSIELADLRASLTTDAFYQCLLDYLANICPAISYEVKL